jgi:hypothetical protein
MYWLAYSNTAYANIVQLSNLSYQEKALGACTKEIQQGLKHNKKMSEVLTKMRECSLTQVHKQFTELCNNKMASVEFQNI